MQKSLFSKWLRRAGLCAALSAFGVAAQAQDPRQTAQRLTDEGARLTSPANYWQPATATQALAKYHEALTVWRRLDDRRQEVATLLRIAAQHCPAGSLVECSDFGLSALAVDYYRKSAAFSWERRHLACLGAQASCLLTSLTTTLRQTGCLRSQATIQTEYFAAKQRRRNTAREIVLTMPPKHTK